MPPPPVQLHVLYAGRGDSMVIRDDTRLIVVDGGPRGRAAGGGGATAPYWRYLRATLADVTTQLGRTTMAPDAIVVTHAHEDHFGGIAALFRHELSATYASAPTAADPLVFNGPLVTQHVTSQHPLPADFRGLLTDFSFTVASDPMPPEALDSFTIAAEPGYSVASRAATNPLVLRDWSVDSSAENLLSVLMYHPTARVLLTGDNVGYVIDPFLDACLGSRPSPQQPRPTPLSLFKVPHHGSARNSQRGQTLATVPTRAWQERTLLCVLSARSAWSSIGVPARLRSAGIGPASQVLRQACTGLQIDPTALYGAIDAAQTGTLAAIAAGNPNPWQYSAVGDTETVWTTFRSTLRKRAAATAGKPRMALRGDAARPPRATFKRARPLRGFDVDWLSVLSSAVAGERYRRDLAYRALCDFYGGFASTGYVISADGTHGHPSPATIAAIAHAATGKANKPTLFVTDGSAVERDAISDIEPGWEQALEVRALAGRPDMVLDVSDPGAANLDPSGSTLPILPGVDVAALQASLQAGNVLTPAQQGAVTITLVSGGTYLGLAPAGFTSNANPQSLSVDLATDLGLSRPGRMAFPASFADVRLRPADDTAAELVLLLGHDAACVVQTTVPLGAPPQYVAFGQPSNLTTDLRQATSFQLTRTPVAGSAGRTSPARVRTMALVGHASLDAEGPQPLAAYLQAVGVPTTTISLRALLDQVMSPADAATLASAISVPVLERVLGWTVDVGASTATWTEDERGPLVTAAALAVTVGTPATFTLDGVLETVTAASATVALAGDGSGPLTLDVAIAAGSLDLRQEVSVATPSRGRALDQYLQDRGLDPAQWDDLTLGGLLSGIVGSTAEAEGLLLRAPTFLVSAGLATCTLDHTASVVEVVVDAGGASQVQRATVGVTLAQPVTSTIAGLAVEVSAISVELHDALLPDAHVGLALQATVAGVDGVTGHAELTGDGASLDLTFTDSTTLVGLFSKLPGAPTLDGLDAPLSSAPGGDPLSTLTFSDIGMVVSQPVVGGDGYVLDEVHGAVTYSGWQSMLPAGWPLKTTAAYVRVLQPLSADRQVALAVVLTFTVGSGELRTQLDVEPAPDVEGAWLVHLGIESDLAAPVTITDLLTAAGLGDDLTQLQAAVPIVDALLAGLAILEAGFTLEASAGGVTIAGTDLDVALVQPWVLLADVIQITTARFQMHVDDAGWSVAASAEAILGTSLVTAELQLPTKAADGHAAFKNDDETLTLSALLALVGVNLPTTLPIIDGLLSLCLRSIELELAPAAPTTSVTAFAATVVSQALAVGPLQLTSLEVSVAHTWPASGGSATNRIQLEADWLSTALSLSYDDSDGTGVIAGSFHAVGGQTLASMLTALGIPGVPSLLGSLGEVALVEGSIELATSGANTVLALHLSIDPSAVLHVGEAAVTHLAVTYVAAKGSDPATWTITGTTTGTGTSATFTLDVGSGPSETTVTGSITSTPGTTGLTATGLLSLFGFTDPPVPTPTGVTLPWDLQATSVALSLSVATGGALTLKAFSTDVQTTGGPLTLLDTTPPLVLTGLALHLEYPSAMSTLTGWVAGQLAIGSVTVTVRYSEPAGQPTFEANLTLGDGPDFAELLTPAGGPFYPGHGLPAGAPTSIPMTSLHVVAEPGTSIDVRGYADTTDWGLAVADLQVPLTALGGHVNITAATKGTAATYEVDLFADVSLHGFVGEASVHWGSARNTVVMATATQAGVDLPSMADALAAAGSWAGTVPANTNPISFTSGAFLYLDVTADTVLLYGALAQIGSGALLSTKPSTGERSWLFVVALADDFTFGSLWSPAAPLDAHVHVVDANLAVQAFAGTVGDLRTVLATITADAAAQGVTFTTPFSDLPALDSTVPPATVLPIGFNLYAALDITGGSLGTTFESIVAEDTNPDVVLSALIDRTTPSNTTITVACNEVSLYGDRLVLDGQGTYTPNSTDQTLVVTGTIVATLVPGGSPTTFTGALTVAPTTTTFQASLAALPTITDPFGGMFGITISEAALSLRLTYAGSGGGATTSTMSISGTVELLVAGQTIPVQAKVLFVDGVPLVAALTIGTIDLVGLFGAVIVAAGGRPWPTGYPTFTLDGADLSYADLPAGTPSTTIDGTPYLAGYHAAARATFFGQPFAIDVLVAPDKSGVLVSGSYDTSIDLVIVQLTGYTDSSKVVHGGPTLTVDTRQASGTTYAFGCGISFFGQPLGAIELAYQPTASKYLCTFTYQGVLLLITNPSITVSWSEADGFQVESIPALADLAELFKWADLLDTALTGSECGEIVGLVFSEVITTSFSVDLDIGGPPSSGGGIAVVTVTGSYTVSAAGEQLFRIDDLLPLHLTLTIPKGSSPEQLLAWLGEQLVLNAGEIVQQLLGTPEGVAQVAKLIALVAADQLAPEVVGALICKGFESENLTAEAPEAVEETSTEVDTQVTTVETAATGAGSATTLTAAVSTLGEALGGLAALAALVTGLLKLIGQVGSFLDPGLKDRGAKAQADEQAAQQQVEAARQAIADRLPMQGVPGLLVPSDDVVVVSWTQANLPTKAGAAYYAGYTTVLYQVDVAADAAFTQVLGQVLVPTPTSPLADQQVTVALSRAIPGNEVWARVAAVVRIDAATVVSGTAIVGSAPHARALPAPTSVTATFADDTITVTVTAVPGATTYDISLVEDLQHTTVHRTQVPAGGPDQPVVWTLAAADLPATIGAGAHLVASVVATGDPSTTRPSPATTATPLPTSGPAAAPQVGVVDGVLTASWPTDANPRGVAATDVRTGSTLVIVDLAPASCTIQADGVADGDEVTVRSRSITAGSIGLWSAATTTTVHLFGPPTVDHAWFRSPEGDLFVTWEPLTGASGYVLEVVAGGGGPLPSDPTTTVSGTTATASGASIAAGGSYQVRVRAAGGPAGAVALWSPAQSVEAVSQSMYTTVTAQWTGDGGLGARCATLDAVDAFVVEVTVDGTPRCLAAPSAAQGGPGYTATAAFDAAQVGPTSGATVEVIGRAAIASSLGPAESLVLEPPSDAASADGLPSAADAAESESESESESEPEPDARRRRRRPT